MSAPRFREPRSRPRWRLVLAAAALFSTALAGCAAERSDSDGDTIVDPTVKPTIMMGTTRVVVCLDSTASITPDDFAAAQQSLARSVRALVDVEPRPALQLSVIELTARVNTVGLAVDASIPPLYVRPPLPEVEQDTAPAGPLPTTEDDQFDSAMAAYNEWAGTYADGKAALEALAAEIEAIVFDQSGATDLAGCLERASRLIGPTQGGQHSVLIAVSDFLGELAAVSPVVHAQAVFVPVCSAQSAPADCATALQNAQSAVAAAGFSVQVADAANINLAPLVEAGS